nr:HNH endonuclease signature motif containing protein [Actinopolymorpha alba]
MQGDLHVRFGGRPVETDPRKRGHRATGRPYCDRPPAWCHGHHVQSWLKGGPTTLANGTLLCGYHHRLIHQDTWQVQLAADGVPEFTPPEWIDQQRNPNRNHRLRT